MNTEKVYNGVGVEVTARGNFTRLNAKYLADKFAEQDGKWGVNITEGFTGSVGDYTDVLVSRRDGSSEIKFVRVVSKPGKFGSTAIFA